MSEIIFLGSIFCSLLTAYLLFFKLADYQQQSGKILALIMIFFAWSAINYLLIYSGWLAEVPFLLKSGAPVNFLIPPFSYFYIRSVLKDQVKISYTDLFHFIPFILVSINYYPVYSLPLNEKLILIQEIISNFSIVYLKAQGFFSDLIISILRMLHALVYLIIQFKMIQSFDKDRLLTNYKAHTKRVFKWLNTFNWLYFAGFLGNIILFVIVFMDPSLANSSQIIMIPAHILALSFLGISSYLLINPEVLFGLPYNFSPINQGQEKKEIIIELPKRDYTKDIEILNRYFEDNMPYLDNSLNINKVALKIGIHSRELSFIINQHFNQRFTDYVNAHRIKYINNKILTGYLNDFTVESLFKEAGFSSKSTFNGAFKKFNHCTPTEFISRAMLGNY
jgi:AraC-like DNA-binding protein